MRWAKAAAGPLAVFAAYFLGSEVGFALRFPPAMTSILWPPNAILTTALLLTPPGRWWTVVLAAWPAHYMVQTGLHLPGALVALLFCTNCVEALVTAGLLRRLSRPPDRFDTLRGATSFLVAIVIGVVVSGFADAAVVDAIRGESYWHVFQSRLFGNILTSLALVPALVAVVRSLSRPTAGPRLRRMAEAALLLVLLVSVGSVVFARPAGIPVASPTWLQQAELLLLLPLLLWAATRFGAAGSSCAILTTAIIAFMAATSDQGGSTSAQAAQSVRGLQVFLLLTGMPLFVLGALMEERRSSERALNERLRFEELLSRVSGAFVHVGSDAMDVPFEAQLRQVCEHGRLRSALLFRVVPQGDALYLAASWSVRAAPSWPADYSPSGLMDFARRRDEVHVDHPDGGWEFGLPLGAGGTLLGMLVFVGNTEQTPDRPHLVPRLRLIGEVFASALARKEGEDALRRGEAMKSAILASLPGQVVVLDRKGMIIAANQGWPAWPLEPGSDGVAHGISYEEACRRTPDAGLPSTEEAVQGVHDVLAGRRPAFTLEYPCSTPVGDRWYALSVVPLRRPEGGAVAAHVDITPRHDAESDARRSREELAHFLRVSTVGELTTSLAHELNQPLTAILANAQAAQLMLERSGDASQLTEILSDIVEEDKRAGEVIQRLRDLLRKRQPERTNLDLNRLAAEVVRLLANDAALRRASIRLDLASHPAVVSGDRIQLQQVLLNLLLNALDAMAERSPDQRIALVTTRATPHRVELAVHDVGVGLGGGGGEGRIFEPFYTTKPSGMGMGLSIARSIVESHGGRIWARDNPGPGATFTFALPISPPSADGERLDLGPMDSGHARGHTPSQSPQN